MATRAVWDKSYVFLNSLGTPRSLGKLRSYLTGTSTRANTYSGDDLSTATDTGSADGMTLNLAGRPPADIFLDPIDYKFVVTNADGTDLITIDPVHGDSLSAAAARLLANGSLPLINVTSYRSAGDVDDTASVVAAAAALQTLGGGTLYFPRGNLNVTAVLSSALVTFTGLNGVTILCDDGATITDNQVYTGSQYAYLFSFSACRNVKVFLKASSQIAVTTSTSAGRGLWFTQFLSACIGVHLDLDITGGIGAALFTGTYNDETTKTRNITGKIRVTGAEYGYVSQYGSSHADLMIDAEVCFRSFYLYGSNSQRLNVHDKNLQGSNIIGAFLGKGERDVVVDYYDRDSNANQTAAPRIAIHWGDSNAATHRNITLRMDTNNPASSHWGHTIDIIKYSDGGTALDSSPRGHVLDGLDISGKMEGYSGYNHFNLESGCDFDPTSGTPDVWKNIHIHDLDLVGSSSNWTMFLTALTGSVMVNNVRSDGAVYGINGTRGLVVFDSCSASNFTAATNSTDTHEYRSSVLTSGSTQNFDINKTYAAKGLFYGMWKNGHRHVTAAKVLAGDLTGTNNLFKVPALASGLSGTIRYHLVGDNSDFSGTRNITRGAKSFSATVNGSGVWTSMLAFADEVTERVKNTGSTVTFSLVNGDATGAYIAVSCSAYSGANAAGQFFIELDGISDKTAVIPA